MKVAFSPRGERSEPYKERIAKVATLPIRSHENVETMTACVHWWVINSELRAVCRRCGAERTFRDVEKLTAKEYMAMRKQAQREVAEANKGVRAASEQRLYQSSEPVPGGVWSSSARAPGEHEREGVIHA